MAFNMDFNEDDMLGGFKQRFKLGVHKVLIDGVIFDITDNGKPYCEFGLSSPGNSEIEDTARFWFGTENARKYSLDIIRGIFIHNAPKDKKDTVRDRFNALKNANELEEAINKMLIGKEAWLLVAEDSERTRTTKDGITVPEVNRNLYGYEPSEPSSNAAVKEKADAPERITGFDEI